MTCEPGLAPAPVVVEAGGHDRYGAEGGDMRFLDRTDAGRQLARALLHAGPAGDAVVLGLPRGGVPVAYEVAVALGADLDVIVVRKLGVPFQPELAMGAIGEGGVRVENRDVLRSPALHGLDLDAIAARERQEVTRRAERYRGSRPRLELRGRRCIVVDDGIATGSTARAACQVARGQGASHVVMAAPVASQLALAGLEDVADEVICLARPEPFYAVGEWYEDFSQTSDADVCALLQRPTGATGSAGW
jgi:putative phosphoribosyl transferase